MRLIVSPTVAHRPDPHCFDAEKIHYLRGREETLAPHATSQTLRPPSPRDPSWPLVPLRQPLLSFHHLPPFPASSFKSVLILIPAPGGFRSSPPPHSRGPTMARLRDPIWLVSVFSPLPTDAY
ncbi:hypothetical protein BRADI_1g33985v3 [Brachypodium distachyon]|uniref:Uncharacterized protein n=1 Tax=Brachypodium distachyon TaxID=15368 RepID=A0A2K2DML0_BRADI|nr:hypothetical protein BRADI_1g33985v3 [Brachypodium distachyon]